MRLTGHHCKESIQYLLNRARLRKYKYREHKLEVPKYLDDAGIEIIDPNKAFQPAPRFPEWEDPIKDDPEFSPPPPITEHPDYHEEPILQFHDRVRLMEGVKQAQVLTKTLYKEGLPPAVTDNIGKVRLPRQDELVQRYIMQANVWDNTKKKIGRARTPETPRNWKFKAETGIPRSRINLNLLHNMIRLCSQIQGTSPELVGARQLIANHSISTVFKRPENNIHLHTRHDHYMMSKYPLPVYANEAETDETALESLPNIYPLSMYIDLVKQHVYREDNNTGWWNYPVDLHPHTLFHIHTDSWLPHVKAAKMLLLTFAHCLSIAKAKYGASKVEETSVDFNADFIARTIPKLEWTAVVAGAKNIGREADVPSEVPGDYETCEDFLKKAHHVLLELEVQEGFLVCPETKRKFPVTNGIPNMLLNEGEA